jgi:AraC family transcriptional regulator of adaptative response/methylated-DNA-[protein]-cysteine methyltransferase
MFAVGPTFFTDAARWRAVESRDHKADGRFVYAVTSTGIYCRPSCPSRRPRADRVRFFDAPDAARASGFRPCRRCQPDEAVTTWQQKVERARRWIDAHPDDRPSLAVLGKVTNTSPWHLQRSFKLQLGVTPREYAVARRANRLKHALREHSVTDAVYEAGYGSPSRVYEEATGVLGMSPKVYGAGGKGERIRFATLATPLGKMIVAATDRGLCRVEIGDDIAALEARLAEEFPAAEIVRSPATLRPLVSAIRRAAEGQPLKDPLPLDLRATAFQRRVWRALQSIPAGETRTYAEIAKLIGSPRASRAVGRACATNPVALAVPCHRVVPGAGGLGGYRWGSERKKKLLDREARNARM